MCCEANYWLGVECEKGEGKLLLLPWESMSTLS